MTSPSMVTRNGDNLIVRSVVSGDTLYGTELAKDDVDDSSAADVDIAEDEYDFDDSDSEPDVDLPQCKVKRNYSCPQCEYYTQNPRFYLYHQKQVHNEKIRIYECASCLYASKHSQKLQRHVHMVHVVGRKKVRTLNANSKSEPKLVPETTPSGVYQMEGEEDEPEPVFKDANGNQMFKCTICSFSSKNREKVQRHERLVHLKKKFWRCAKCNYVTHMKARYTKHVKYHSMPMIKCDLCDFRTPYKWNLDRHNKNHTGDGPFKCSICNFTAEIKQSLTVHEMNHHVPPVGHLVINNNNRRRLKVGASDTMGLVTEEDQIEQSELELLRMEREGANFEQGLTNSINIKVGPTGCSWAFAGPRRSLRTKSPHPSREMPVTKKKHQDEKNPADFVQAQLDIPTDSSSAAEAPSEQPARPQLIQISKYSCKACNFKGNLGEVQRHEQEKHQITGIFPEKPDKVENISEKSGDVGDKFGNVGDKSGSVSDRSRDTPERIVVAEKKKRPIPNLIPIQSQKPRSGELTKENVSKFERNFEDLASLVNDRPGLSKSPEPADTDKKIDSFKKKNASFFDKLKEKLMTSANMEGMLTCTFCGHEAKCLSEHMKHQKSHIPGERDDQSESSFGSQGVPSVEPSSIRCKHCRHRCKSSSDLTLHLQTCPEAPAPKPIKEIKTEPEESPGNPHPMENKVFIWNTLTENSNFPDEPYNPVKSPKQNEEKAFVGIEVKPGYGTTTNDGQEETITSRDVNTKKVFKCPHCTFWASTASRFHVHIVGHLNKRPFQCSLCHYSSNWRWDITKHIRLKTIRDPTHEKAKVLLTDETGRRNYSKYNKYLTTMKMESQHLQHSHQQTHQPQSQQSPNKLHRKILPKEGQSSLQTPPGSKRPSDSADENDSPKKKPHVENKKTMWKCKKCYFRNTDREVVLEHVRDHYRNASEGGKKKKKLSGKPDTLKKEDESSGETDDRGDSCPSFMCETCPFTCPTWLELEAHSEKHFVCTVNGKQFKCTYCSFYAQDNEELGLHLATHATANAQNDADLRSGAHACTQCPYVAINGVQLIYHRRRHGQNDAQCTHKCYKCSYGAPNNTILALHVRLHGRHNLSEPTESKPPAKLPADISKQDTSGFPDIPMVWVSKPMGISKMFKCRFCPHINMRKGNIQEHEKMHRGTASPFSGPQHKCPDCDYICNNAGVLSAHFKVHQGLFGQVVGVVDSSKPDDEQIAEMKERLTQHELPCPSSSLSLNADPDDQPDDRVLRFCGICPARFLLAKEMKIHFRFHELKLLYKCDSCTYTARQKQHLEAHFKVHTDEYQDRTNVLTSVYDTDPENPRPKIAAVLAKDSKDSVWVVVKDEPVPEAGVDRVEFAEPQRESSNKNNIVKQYSCSKCPAEFFKSVALSYHETLHGGEGQHKCKSCDYAVKTYGNLVRHEAVHKSSKKSEKIPTSGTELVKQKNEASKSPEKSPAKSPPPAQLTMDPEFGLLIHGSPEFIYPTYLKNGKTKEKRYKCHKCPSAFEKREQYKVHLSLHGSRQRYHCKRCDYSVKYYANYIQHIKKHQLNDASQKEKKVTVFSDENNEEMDIDDDSNGTKNVDRCSKTMKLSTADEQALMLMQQRNISNGTVLEKDVISRCPHCPYTNNRKDGVTSHIRCHSNPRGGPYMCKYCDYTVSQFNFLRDHTKIHFSGPKFVKPDAYMKVEHMEIWAEPLEADEVDKKFLVFKDQGVKVKQNRFLPPARPDLNNVKGRIYINLRTGEEEIEVDEDVEKNAKVNDESPMEDEEEYTQPDDNEDKPNLQPDSKSEDSSKYSSCSDSE